MPTTLSALSLPFDEAIAYFAQKTNATSTHWTDVWQRANARAFTVAGAATEALVQDFRTEVAKALEQGTTLADFRQQFDAIVKKHGWQHTGTPGWRAGIIYETNLSMAYSAGRYAQATEPETLAQYPYWQYVHSGALHPRLQHLSWNGLVLRADDPWWGAHYPPNGWHCGCRVRVLSARGLARQGKSGPDQAPPTETYTWINPKTGEAKLATKGIDPGFDYNPGQVWQATPVAIPPNATLSVPPIPGIGTPAPAANEYPWPEIQPRNLENLRMAKGALQAGREHGLWSSARDARRFVGKIVAGTPAEEKLTATVVVDAKRRVLITANSESGTVAITRKFSREVVEGRPRTIIDHAYFDLDERYQGGGHARAMLRAAVEEYRRLGNATIELHANLDVGGYAWARMGFVPRGDIGRLRSDLLERIRGRQSLAPADRALLSAVVRNSADRDLMYDLANAVNRKGEKIGKRMLLGSSWHGALDLGDEKQYARLLQELAKK